MYEDKSIWTRKGTILSDKDKSARQEFGLTQQEIITAIRAGKLQFRESNMHGNPCFRLLRHEVEALVTEKSGQDHLHKKKLQKELADIKRDTRKLKTQLANRLVEVGPDPDDVIRPLGFKYSTLTLGDLRAFLERYKDAPDEIPVTVALPLGFFSDEDELPPDHPEYKAVSACQSVDASGIAFMAFSASGEMAEGYIPPEKRGGEGWDFSVEIMPHDEQCYEAMRERGDE
jgi:hypothetical protein